MLLCRALSSYQATLSKGCIVISILAAIAYGAILELCQLAIPYRNADMSDIAADAVGAALSGLLWPVLSAYFPKLVA